LQQQTTWVIDFYILNHIIECIVVDET